MSSGTYTQSIFAKKKDKDFIVCYSANAERTYFNLSNGTIGTIASGNTAKIEDYGNGWYRCTITYTLTSGGVIAFYLSDSDNSSVVTDSGGVYIYGAQVEAGSYPTTLINTSGSSVTRNADACSITNVADRINSSEGVLYAEIAALANDGTKRRITINNGLSTQFVQLEYSVTTNTIKVGVYNGSSQGFFTETLSDLTTFNKIAYSYKANEFKLFANGIQLGTTITSGTTFSSGTLTTLSFDNGAGNDDFYGNIKQLQVYNTALTDQELVELTGGTFTVYNWIDNSSNRIINENGDTIIFT